MKITFLLIRFWINNKILDDAWSSGICVCNIDFTCNRVYFHFDDDTGRVDVPIG
jgi:hypothetical protein